MPKKLNIYFILIALVFNGLFVTTLLAQEKQEVVVTIDEIPCHITNPDFLKGEEFRKQYKFIKAIAEYEKVISSDEPESIKAEVLYHIGICYTWLGKVDEAESVFKGIVQTYSDNGKVVAYSNYCLSWVDIQRLKLQDAIDRLEWTLDENLCSEEEFCSHAQFQIGRIYQSYMHDYAKAEEAFKKVLEKYPNSKITSHSFFNKIKAVK